MKEALFWTCLILGTGCILVQLVTYLIASIKSLKPDAKPVIGATAAGAPDIPEKIAELLKALVEKAPLLVGGVLLILIAAVFSGTVDASLTVK